ncbi:MAG: carboxypeptidase regulatory-like domain-containing protein [Thiothrix sp.]|nr:carboxypeptidase regulatory-like domain-containing protein [Thiothrix sp.]
MLRNLMALMILLFISAFFSMGYSATKAGTRIVNQAEASYFDPESGTIIRILSNYATLVVAPQLAVQQDQDQSQLVAPGQPIYFPHTIINTGNQADSYRLTVENLLGDNGELENIRIYLDENGDGQVNPGEPEITETTLMQPNDRIQVIVAATMPVNATAGSQYGIRLITTSVNDPGVTDSDIDTASVTDGAIIRISRVSDVDCSIMLNLNDKSYHEISYTNVGNRLPPERTLNVDGTPLSGILIADTIPDPFQLVKEPAFFAEPVQALRLVANPLGEWSRYEQWDGIAPVTRVGVLLPADKIKPAQSGKFGYTLQVTSQSKTPEVSNLQSLIDLTGDGTSDFQSNIACNTVKPQEPDIIKGRPELVLSGTVFDSADLQGVPGATVNLMSADGNMVASVVSNAEGYYEFINIPKGSYYLVIVAPLTHDAPSLQAPAKFTTYQVSDPSYGLPGYQATPDPASTSKAGLFELDPAKASSVLDIPLDKKGIRGQIAIDKSASTETVSIGELVSYTIKIRNLTEADLYAAYIKDQLPVGFKYISGTARLDGKFISDPALTAGPDGAHLNFRVGDFLKGIERTLTYVVQVTALAASSKEGINTAYAHGDTITDLLVQSPPASASVRIVQDGVLSDRAILFGRLAVAKDCAIGNDASLNARGFPLAGVRLYLEDGSYVITDPNGQYSLYGLTPGIHVLKVDEHTLPEGVELTLTDQAQAGDPDSRFVDLTPGDFHRADFVAACPQPIERTVTRCPEPRPAPPKTRTQVLEPEREVRQCEDRPVRKTRTTTVTRSIDNAVAPIHFDSGKADIPPDYAAKLNQLIHLTRDKQNVRFKFVGHTDNQRLKPETKARFGTNQGLSEARASEVAQYVLSKLHIQSKVQVAGKGETQPVAGNDTPQGMARNRRVELVMLYDEPRQESYTEMQQSCTTQTIPAKTVITVDDSGSDDLRQPCEIRKITDTSPVGERILARHLRQTQGWGSEVERIDPANTGNLKNLARLADKNGDISNGLLEAYTNQVREHQENFAREQAQTEQEKAPQAPDPKEAVKTLTKEQGKAGTWLWPLDDTSLDGRFMVVVRAGMSPSLSVNGKTVSASQLGEQIENKSAGSQILAWYGVELEEGENTVKVTAKDTFGNERVLAEKAFKRPSSGVAIEMKVDGTLQADRGQSTVPVHIRVLDRNGYPARGAYYLTLEASDGTWAEPDIQDKVPGHQVKVTNGERTVHLRSSAQSGLVKLRASTGELVADADVSQVAEMRPLVAVGLLDLRAHQGYRTGYENLGLIMLDKDEQDIEVNGRAAIFMKGRIRGDMHLTMAYDSEKDKETELLRDIDPEQYYPVYGDASVRGFEAQSRSPLYLKLERERHSLMWGDYVTDNEAPAADIARSSRTLTGLSGIYDNGTTRVQLFGAETDNPRAYVELRGNGTAMQYQLQDVPLVRNSEVIEIITRDRNNPGLVVDRVRLQRFRDYSLDDLSGYLSFHRVIPTLDDNLNPVYVGISYDRDETVDNYLVAGVRVLHRFTDRLQAGASYTRDNHDTEGYDLTGAFAEYKDENTRIQAGVARMNHANGDESGQAVRLQASHQWNDKARTEATIAQADAGFTNSSSGVTADRREIKLNHQQKLTPDLEGKVELTQSESLSTDDKRQTLELSATTRLDDWKIKAGVRQIRQTDDTTDETVNTALLGLERQFDVLDRKVTAKGEYEREVGGSGRERISVGADVQLTDKTKAYLRYEQADRLGSGTLSSTVDTRNSLVAGVKSQVLPSTEMYSEYRIEGDISGEDMVAVNGGKATLNLEDNLVVTPSIEFLNYVEGDGGKDSIAASVGVRDTRDPNSKKLLRAETRHSEDEDFYGLKGTYVAKVTDSTSVMVQDELRYQQYGDERDDAIRNTLTLAAAHRPSGDGDYNALYAYKWDKDDANNVDTHVLSTHQNYRINESMDISGRLGAKQQILQADGLSQKSNAMMADARFGMDINERLSMDLHGGVLATDGGSEHRYSVGAGLSYTLMDNVQIGAGYNFSGFRDRELDSEGFNAKGAYVGLQMKVDEDLFTWLSGDEKQLINAQCEPLHPVERLDAEQQKMLEKQRTRCRQALGMTDDNPPSLGFRPQTLEK